jgi:hypothetical protein
VEGNELSLCIQIPVKLPGGESPPVCSPCYEVVGDNEVTIETESVTLWDDDGNGGRRSLQLEMEYWRDKNGNTNKDTTRFILYSLSRLNCITPLYEDLIGDVILAEGVVEVGESNLTIPIGVDCYFLRVEFHPPYPVNLRQFGPMFYGFGTARLSVPGSGQLPEVYSLRSQQNLIPVSGVKGRGLVVSIFPGLSYTVYATNDIPQGHLGRVRATGGSIS